MDKKNKFFLVLCIISALLIGIILSPLLFIAEPLLGHTYSSIFSLIGLLVMLSLLTYFSFSYFDIQEKTILFITLPISIIISMMAVFEDYLIITYLLPLQTQYLGENITPLFNFTGIFDIWVLVAMIIIIYNLPSIIFMLTKKKY